ncbi:NUDIX domain-containing protein [Paracoccus sp. 11-3]|uniref:NUDIX domain-containing protein n=1 Tax=Paracoccus amoyensis TaxID=2760093 RepID=A0A926GBI0_9RHOB|nr:NUDIX domain-containing protein [Paracoccus amoyensis]
MSDRWILVGPMAQPNMLAAFGLTGQATEVAGTLIGGQMAGIEATDWPALIEGGVTPAVTVQPNNALRRYVQVMGLQVVSAASQMLVGVQDRAKSDQRWNRDEWLGDLAAEIASLIIEAPKEQAADLLAWRLPMLGVWAASRLRGRASQPSGGDLVVPRTQEDMRVIARHQPFAGFFAVDRWDLSHRTFAGGFTPRIVREGFVSGDAVVLLPWDPVRDRVMVIEQFRLIPALRHDPQPWLLEPIAGRVDAGENVEDAARREALEEANLTIDQLFPAVHHYPSPGTLAEYLYLFVGIADLPDGIAGVHGLAGETEDIRGHVITREKLLQMVADGQIANGPLAMIALWLQVHKDRLAKELALT